MLTNQKKIGIALVLSASVLLIAAFLAVPFGAAVSVRNVLAIIGAVLLVIAAPIMWRDGVKRIKEQPWRKGSLLSMRQSGFFDIIVLLLIITVILAALSIGSRKLRKKKISPIPLIGISAVLGILMGFVM